MAPGRMIDYITDYRASGLVHFAIRCPTRDPRPSGIHFATPDFGLRRGPGEFFRSLLKWNCDKLSQGDASLGTS